jgi:predicted RNA binding protein YcfA (HicA-like mRNA interferase family)
MSKLSPLKPLQVIRRLRKLGFIGPVPGGRHARMVNFETGKIIPTPIHKGKDVSVGLIRSILSEIDITPEEWNRL